MTKDKPEPFHISTTPGNILAVECATLDAATKMCAEKNAAAAKLGVKTTFKVVESPYPFK